MGQNGAEKLAERTEIQQTASYGSTGSRFAMFPPPPIRRHDVFRRDNEPMKHSLPPRLPPSAAARARVRALRRGEAPVVRDPEEARGLTFVSPAERRAAFALAARKRRREHSPATRSIVVPGSRRRGGTDLARRRVVNFRRVFFAELLTATFPHRPSSAAKSKRRRQEKGKPSQF